jgi:spermidine synthase
MNDSANHAAENEVPGPSNRNLAIFAISVLGLFLELILIRWVSTEVRIFAYLQNTVLVVCFLGIGMGCFTCRKPISVRGVLFPFAILVLLLSIPVTRIMLHWSSDLLSLFSDLQIWNQLDIEDAGSRVVFFLMGFAISFILMALIWDMFVPIGRMLARLMDDHPRPIQAYSVNVAGSLAGSWVLVLLSWFYAPPVVWVAVFALLLFLCFRQQLVAQPLTSIVLAATIVLGIFAGMEPGSLETTWSPYQKLTLVEADETHPKGHKYLIHVNNTGYQAMIDLSDRREDVASGSASVSQYDVPCLLHPDPEEVLIVGAGSGNDVAGALRNGAGRVTAVEIDRAILDMGERYHPESPYQDERVNVVIDDARSYFARCNRKFDVISFGLLDSHTTTSLTNARLDHYVYTRESFSAVRQLLKPGGLIVVNFDAQYRFIADRIGRTLRDVCGEEPKCFGVPAGSSGWGGVIFVAGDLAQATRSLSTNPALKSQIDQWGEDRPIDLSYTTPIATDDWPYLYLKNPRLPKMYPILGLLLILLFVRGHFSLEDRSWIKNWGRSHWHFFFLGAAFMLLEVQSISKAAVVLGNTWWVNSIVISGVLIMVLLANAIAYRFPNIPILSVALLLIGSCIGLYFIDLARFAFLPYRMKAVIVGGLTTLPMLFSGIFFIRSFAVSPRKDLALGANLLGALFGGLAQSLTFLIGVKALLLVVAGLYLAAVLTTPRQLRVDEERPLPAEEGPEPLPEAVEVQSPSA